MGTLQLHHSVSSGGSHTQTATVVVISLGQLRPLSYPFGQLRRLEHPLRGPLSGTNLAAGCTGRGEGGGAPSEQTPGSLPPAVHSKPELKRKRYEYVTAAFGSGSRTPN